MNFDMTARVKEAWEYYDKQLDDQIEKIAERAKVEPERLIKINPAEFIEKTRFQTIKGYHYQKIRDWITKTKTDDVFLISPLDAVEETAEQIGYKAETGENRKIRASKCEIYPVPKDVALDFFIRNHRQTAPLFLETAVCLGLVFKGELVAVMMYDTTSGAVRGSKEGYELVRLAIAKNTQVHGGASKLQNACEDVMRQMGVYNIFSYSNATINNGKVYEKLGFTCKSIDGGQPFVIDRDFELIRLVNLNPYSTDEQLALRGRLKTHVGGNKLWTKSISKEGAADG